MKFDKVIMNPPYYIGGKIWDVARKFSKDIICLMPFSQYEDKERYLFIKDILFFDTLKNSLFNACLSKNLCITSNQDTKNNKNLLDFLIQSFDINYMEAYIFNIKNFKGFSVHRKDYDSYQNYNIDLDFLESNRYCSYNSVRDTSFGYGNNRWGYLFNLEKKGFEDRELSGLSVIHFNTPREKNNFSKWWYSTPKDNTKSLSFKLNSGLGKVTVGYYHSYAIPQIDWEKISDHPLWEEGKYDEAVLDTMGLRWEDNSKTKIIKKD